MWEDFGLSNLKNGIYVRYLYGKIEQGIRQIKDKEVQLQIQDLFIVKKYLFILFRSKINFGRVWVC